MQDDFETHQRAYHAHLDQCAECRNSPMLTRCTLGPKLLQAAALSGAAHMPVPQLARSLTQPELERKIVSARFTAMPRPLPEGMFDPLPEAWVRVEGRDAEVRLFDWYPDEITFTEAEFVGLTVAAAMRLKLKKDTAYLQS